MATTRYQYTLLAKKERPSSTTKFGKCISCQSTHKAVFTTKTRSSAVSERPRNASCWEGHTKLFEITPLITPGVSSS